MKAMVLGRFGGVDAFGMRDVPAPPVGARQVRVRVHATAINPLDYQIRRGDYADHVPPPAIVGHDVSGVVEEKGESVTEFDVGDAVYNTPKIFGGPGSHAEQHVADVDLVARKPSNIDHVEAASLTLVGGTVWEALVTRARLAVHETVPIHSGAGGVGTVAIQLARAMGARVIATARRANHAFVRALGVDDAIDHAADDYVSAVAELTHDRYGCSRRHRRKGPQRSGAAALRHSPGLVAHKAFWGLLRRRMTELGLWRHRDGPPEAQALQDRNAAVLTVLKRLACQEIREPLAK